MGSECTVEGVSRALLDALACMTLSAPLAVVGQSADCHYARIIALRPGLSIIARFPVPLVERGDP